MLNPRIQMRLIKFSQCNKTLDFKPQCKWPRHLPAIAVGNILVAGFETELEMAVEVDGAFESVLKDCYSDLTLPEFARLYKQIKTNNVNFEWPIFLNLYHQKWSLDFEKALIILSETPDSFQGWVSVKSLGLQDLSPLVWYYLSDKDNMDSVLTKFNALTNKSLGVKIIEWAVELLAQKLSVAAVVSKSSNTEEWHKYLYSLRFQRAHNEDKKWQDRILEIPWPRHVSAQWKRAGDQAAVEIKFSALNAKDFETKATQITSLKEKISELWNQS